MARACILTLILCTALASGVAAQGDDDCETEGECLLKAIGWLIDTGIAIGDALAHLDSAAASRCPPGTFPSRCGTLVPMFEATLSFRMSGDEKVLEKWFSTWEIGGFVRTGHSTALGATLFANVDRDGGRLGIRPRFRQWLSDELVVDVGAGVFFTSSVESVKTPGFAGAVSFGEHDAGLVLHVEWLRDARVPDTGWRTYLGLRTRGPAAMGLTALEGIMYLVAAAFAF